MASEINLKPIVIHQIKKNGLSALNRIPMKNGPCFGKLPEDDSLKVVLTCSPAKTKRLMAPSMAMYSRNCGKAVNEIAPIPRSMTSGSSTIVCPHAILIPVFHPPRMPYATFAVKRGPGDMTPETEIVMTVNANSSNVVMCTL